MSYHSICFYREIREIITSLLNKSTLTLVLLNPDMSYLCKQGRSSSVGSIVFGSNGLHHAKTCLRAYVDSKGPDQPVHQGLDCSLTEPLDTKECMNGEQRRG